MEEILQVPRSLMSFVFYYVNNLHVHWVSKETSLHQSDKTVLHQNLIIFRHIFILLIKRIKRLKLKKINYMQWNCKRDLLWYTYFLYCTLHETLKLVRCLLVIPTPPSTMCAPPWSPVLWMLHRKSTSIQHYMNSAITPISKFQTWFVRTVMEVLKYCWMCM